jgi:hypothetical protein
MGLVRVAAAAVAAAFALAACGAFGEEPSPPGADAAVDGSGGETGAGGDATSDATSDAPDVRPTDMGKCPLKVCASNDPNCTDDTCDGTDDWPVTGPVTESTGDCRAKTSGSPAFLSKDAKATDGRRFVDLQFLANALELPNRIVLAQIAAGTRSVNVLVVGAKLSLCEREGTTDVRCTPETDAILMRDNDMRLFGQVTAGSTPDAFVLQVGCTDVARLTLSAPLTGTLTTKVGCVTSGACDFVLDDITFNVFPN